MPQDFGGKVAFLQKCALGEHFAEETGGMTEMLTFPDVASWERWLAEHSDSATEVWLRIARKGASFTTVTASEGIDGALCFGWIDSHRKG